MTPLIAARVQMAVSLGFHIIFASIGVGLPVLLLFAEWKANKTGDATWMALARRWSKAFGILFAVGAVSGTVLSFALGLFWPRFMGRWGSVIGLPFALEAFAFFIEAIFLGIYLYGWERLTPRAHWLSGWPVALSGAASAWFVVTANAWMNAPQGFTLGPDGKLTAVDPWKAVFNPGTPVQTTHMLLAAYLATGFTVAAVYAAGMLRGRNDDYHRKGLAAGLVLGAVLIGPQIIVGDWAARFVAERQPIKLAALEGQWETVKGAPLRIGGIPNQDKEETPFSLEIPKGLSILAKGDPNAEIKGLKEVPRADRPNTTVVHISFQLMVSIGFGLLGLAAWAGWSRWRRKKLPSSSLFLKAVVASGPASFVAIETGWMVTEIGRQPWIVQGYMRVKDAVTTNPGIVWHLAGTVVIYILLAAACVYLLLKLASDARSRGDAAGPGPATARRESQGGA